MHIKLKNNVGVLKECKVGFSWTTLFFGFFPALFRGDFKWALVMFIVGWLTAGVSYLVFCFVYNGLYIKDLLSKGYEPVSEEDREILIRKGFVVR